MALIDMAKVSDTDLAYAAGMIDGDGCISVNKSPYVQKSGSRSFMVTVRVSQKLEEIPLWFCATFGGKLRRMGKEKLTLRADGTQVRFVPMYAWEVYCQDAADFLEAVSPYMRMKRHRAELAIKLARMHRMRGGRGWRLGGLPVSPEENEAREEIALLIRSENQKGNDRVAMTAKWGIN